MNPYIQQLNLQKHPEGGHYCRVYTSAITTEDRTTKRPVCSSIYYLLQKTECSCWHRLDADETWHYYEGGSSIQIHCITPNGDYNAYLVGRVEQDARFQLTIPRYTWFAAELTDKTSFALAGCTVSPAFDFNGFELADTNSLVYQYPELKNTILRLSR